MRQIGTLDNQQQAERFTDYLLTLGISARADGSPAGYSLWVFEENDVERAKQELAEFQLAPEGPVYLSAQKSAQQLRQNSSAQRRQAEKNLINLGERWQNRGQGRAPLTILLIVASVIVTIITDFGDRLDIAQWFLLSAESPTLPEVRSGQVWRLFTPMFLHLNLWHLLFNMIWLFQLGSQIEIRRGTWQLLALVLVGSLAGSVGQFLAGEVVFGGMSGVVYALFGYAWMKSQFDPTAGIYLDSTTVVIMLGWLVLCWAGAVGKNVANEAHVAGLIVGVVFGYAPLLWRR